jgi:hypothetical protein
MEVSGQLHAQAALPPGGKPPGTHWIGGFVSLRAGMESYGVEKYLLSLSGIISRPSRQ